MTVFHYTFIVLLKSSSERIFKIGRHLAKLWARVLCLVSLTHRVVTSAKEFLFSLRFVC